MTYLKTKYATVAVEAACTASDGAHPITAWKIAAAKVFVNSPSSEHKSCPKSAFLGLAELGEIADINKGKYTRSKSNKKYAETGLRLLRENELWANNPQELWLRVMNGSSQKHNSQMDVVIALWRAKKFVGQNT